MLIKGYTTYLVFIVSLLLTVAILTALWFSGFAPEIFDSAVSMIGLISP